MAKRGRRPWKPDPVMIERIREYAKTGSTIEQIAHVVGIGKTTFHKALNEIPEIVNALKEGRSTAAVLIAGKLYESAKSGNTTAQIFYLKAQAGWKDRVEVSGDANAPVVIAQGTVRPLNADEVGKAVATLAASLKGRRKSQ